MVIYRPNRGMRSEAMEQAREFDSRESMLEYVCRARPYKTHTGEI